MKSNRFCITVFSVKTFFIWLSCLPRRAVSLQTAAAVTEIAMFKSASVAADVVKLWAQNWMLVMLANSTLVAWTLTERFWFKYHSGIFCFCVCFLNPPPSPKKPKNPLQNKIRNQAQEEKALLTLCRTTICVIFGITCRHLYVLQFALSERWWNPRTWQAVACFTGS